jgi:hypothetical protein
MMPGRHTVRASKGGLSADESLDAIAGQRMYVTLALPEGSRMTPVGGAVAAGVQPATSAAPALEPIPELNPSSAGAAPPESDAAHSQGFFTWLGDTPLAVATLSVAGLALGTSAVLAGFANNRYASANNARDQIMKALEDYVNNGVLVGTAVPCGPDGVANRRDSFDSRTRQESVDYLTGAFGAACARFSERSDSGDRLKTLSLVSLGVGAFAAVGTVVWYFSDTGSSTDKASAGPAPRQARLTPVLGPGQAGLQLDMSF